jgi:uncharacterized protein YjbI with pentapeptide repeats
MANQRHVEMLTRNGVDQWNQWREEEPSVRPDLSEADLRGAKLGSVDLHEADLRGANLWKADLSSAELRGSNLWKANLGGANLEGANLWKADLSRADLGGGWLRGSNLTEADLSEADLSKADLRNANLWKANLSRAILNGATLIEANLRGANLSEAKLIQAKLRWANLSGADLRGAWLSLADLTAAILGETICVGTKFDGATLTGCNVYGIAAWDLTLHDAIQKDLRITPVGQRTNITVDNLEVAQFLYLLLSNPKVREVLDTITSKVVLILGRFSDERKPVLDALREALRRHPNRYIPVLFDFDSQQDQPVFETVKTLANLARFVIADLTDPNMVRSELTYITTNVPTVPVKPVILFGAPLPTEYGTWKKYKSFLDVYQYADLPQLVANLSKAVITPVEGHVRPRPLAEGDSAH